jgi:diguanylate cyclase (GGDEF)-like protein
LKNTPSAVALLAALGLFGLTLVTAVRQGAALSFWQIATIAVAWVAVLASALVARARLREDAEVDQAPPGSGAPTLDAPEPPSNESGTLLEFARELHAVLDSDGLRALISKRLPSIMGRDAWVVARFGTRQQIIVPSVPGRTDAIPMLGERPRQWATYPMKVEGSIIGVLGAAIPSAGVSARDHRLLESLAALVGQSLSTANAFESVREASLVDSLTGCAMRAEGMRRFQAELRRADRSHTALAVLMLDLDHFKSINDRFGHRTGDAVLSAVGQALLTSLRASDVRCRWGGEEFLLVLPESSVERARKVSDKLRQRIANTPVRVENHLVHVTASIGITISQPGEMDIQQALARADAALYHAKRLGRNRIRFVLGAPPAPSGRAPEPPAGAAPPERRDSWRREPQRSEREWTGPERRDPNRRDRRRFPGPGRRRTDAEVVAGPWAAR